MLQVDLPAAFAAGQVMAIAARHALKKEPALFTNRFHGPLNIFLACGFAPVGLYFLVGWPGWELMYMTAWFENPFNRPLATMSYPLFLMAMVFLGNAGFILGHAWVRKGHDRLLTASALVAGALALAPFLFRYGAWCRVGTFAEIKAGGGYPFYEAPFMTGWLIVFVYMFITSGLAFAWFRHQGKSAKDRSIQS